ncbi:GntR family transcriptional regulator, arabinose operon transcriptional repressor [Gracilibacillus ureilyticus]|uniref:GntR family transcriptional regulator, arabinose operon transcriptional repressor n=1 Tax=Gracilibacillus ureilyticus TaxID=531814 RepID=A0A1H9MX93_9BACI|nr:GntR family transcriptional regulator [Gracilibacillus ureilyticus]SER28330.1 GntR family transcriptional regulator, arabinose operon transcriptional repressor [Gracilibacillus ureilyticus]
MGYSEAKYKKIKQSIKTNILKGLITTNEKISSESQLMKEFKVSRHTVRLAIGELVNEGWLYREQGAGTFCADRRESNLSSINENNKNIAIVTTFISEYIFPTIIRGAESYLSEHGYNVSIFNTNNQYNQEEKILTQILSSNYAGVIIEPTHSASANPNLKYYLNMEKEKIPYVMINAMYEELEPVSFSLDDVKGGFLQTKHLIDLGHRDIVCIYKTDDAQGQNRLKGYIKAHRECNLRLNPKNIITYQTENEHSKPIDDLKELLKVKADCPTAVVCYNDQLVLRLLDFVREEGIKVPEHLSFVGYDDSLLAELSEVKLTSVIHPKSELGRDAARAIIRLIQKNNQIDPGEDLSKLYEPQLKIRHSTAPIDKDLAI